MLTRTPTVAKPPLSVASTVAAPHRVRPVSMTSVPATRRRLYEEETRPRSRPSLACVTPRERRIGNAPAKQNTQAAVWKPVDQGRFGPHFCGTLALSWPRTPRSPVGRPDGPRCEGRAGSATRPTWAKSGRVAKVCGGAAISGRRAATARAVSLGGAAQRVDRH